MQAECYTIARILKRFRTTSCFLIKEGIAVGVLAGFTIVLFRCFLDEAGSLLNTVLAFGKAHTWFAAVWFVILAAVALVIIILLKWESYISGSAASPAAGGQKAADSEAGDGSQCRRSCVKNNRGIGPMRRPPRLFAFSANFPQRRFRIIWR